jgi:hypothetical protein
LVASLALLGAEKDLGTGYRLENVQVMDPAMRLADARRYMLLFNDALGVTCRDCHDLRDFSSDEKPLKLIAREMMRMTKEINETWYPDREEETVSCWTCHQGSRVPTAAPADVIPSD